MPQRRRVLIRGRVVDHIQGWLPQRLRGSTSTAPSNDEPSYPTPSLHTVRFPGESDIPLDGQIYTAVELSQPDTLLHTGEFDLLFDGEISDDKPSKPVSLFRVDHFSVHSNQCLDGHITQRSKYVVGSGSYADIWTGSLDGQMVAIKIVRPFKTAGSRTPEIKLLKRVWREYLAWSGLSHPNILQCLGFTYDFALGYGHNVPSLISPWMPHGTVIEYISKYPDVDRLKLLVGIAEGLSYLHDRKPGVIHGGLRGAKVLVSGLGVACLTGFGLSRVLDEIGGLTTTSDVAGSLRWMSPELFTSSGKDSKASDVWAYGMTVLEILSGRVPYEEFQTNPRALLAISRGITPSRRADDSTLSLLTDDVWGICQKCWNIQPAKRVPIPEVLLRLKAVHQQTMIPSHSEQDEPVSSDDSDEEIIPNIAPSSTRFLPPVVMQPFWLHDVLSAMMGDDSTFVPAAKTTKYFSPQSSLCLDGQITGRSKYVVATGGFADIWTGSFGSHTVAIKTMRPFSSAGTRIQRSKLLKRLWREYLAWSSVSHPNIHNCLGFSYDFSPESEDRVPSLISPWMANGSVTEYLAKNSSVDRLKLLVGIAEGLSHLHNLDPVIVHGDIRAGNTLVSDMGVPCLTDFGLSRTLCDIRGLTTTSEAVGSLCWMAPELFNGAKVTVSSDVWAYGMSILEILSGNRPHHEFKIHPALYGHIIAGGLPSRPSQGSTEGYLVTDDIWQVCQKCWRFQPRQRPSIRHAQVGLLPKRNFKERFL